MEVSIESARQLGGRYQLHTMLGRGGVAAVWAGIDTRLDRPVAVKILDGAARADPEMIQRLDLEARAVARLAHPNIVAVYDVGMEGGVPYLVMELVDGHDLQRQLRSGPLGVDQAVRIGGQICDALEAAHEAGVVHRDIKPDNILLARSGSVKVCDFGIARLQQAAQVHVTGPAATVGTSEYMAPEQATGATVDARTDLYALGCVLYAMLTGAPPFTGSNPMRVLWRQVHDPPEPLATHRPGVPTDLEALVARLLAKSPADRPDGAAQVRSQLERLHDSPAEPAWTHGDAGTAEPVHARAAVVTRTRTMPALHVASEQSPARTGLRVGPVGIAAVAAGTAAVTALVIALATQSLHEVANSPTSPVGTTSATSTVAATAATVDSVRAAIQMQVQAGALDNSDARSLTGRLDDIDRNLARGRVDNAAQRLGDLRDRLSELLKDGKITAAGYDVIVTVVDQLAGTLPSNGGDNN
jgi:serine/threonine-protein kinase